jgi:hypothetical protein
MAENDDFIKEELNESKDEKLDEALNLNDLINQASGLLKNSMNVQDLPIENANSSVYPDPESILVNNSESINMSEMFNMASQLMKDPNFFESLPELFNDVEQKETVEEFISLPINLPGILNMVGGLTNGLNVLNSLDHAEPFESTILKELGDLREQIEKLNQSIIELKEELR